MVTNAFLELSRSVPSVLTLSMRRAALARRLSLLLPREACELFEEIGQRAGAGSPAARLIALTLTSLIARKRRRGDTQMLSTFAEIADEAGLALTRSLCGDEPAAKSLAPRGRLPEVGFNRDAYFPALLPARLDRPYGVGSVEHRRLAADGLTFLGSEVKSTDTLLRCPNAAFVTRFLRTRWARQCDVISVAARRPSIPEIAIAIATDDRWLCDARVRAALEANPFTPRWLALGIRLATPARGGNGFGYLR